MNKMHRHVSIAAAVLLLGACGGGDDTDASRALDRLVDGYTSTVCSALVTCSCTSASAREDCEVAYRTMLTVALAQAAIESPSHTIDPAAVDTCLSDLRAAVQGCPGPVNEGSEIFAVARVDDGMGMIVPSCDSRRLMIGTQAAGAYCSQSRDCAPGLACNHDTRACEPPAGVDEPCASVGCDEDLYCDSTQLCRARPAVGEACPDGACQAGSTCATVDGEPTCVAPRAAGGACNDGALCASGNYCDHWDTGLCAAIVADGGDCTSDWECEHLWCTTEGTCADPGFCDLVGRGKR